MHFQKIIIVIILTSPFISRAQKIRLNAVAGMNYSNVISSYNINGKNDRTGMVLGANLHWMVKEKIGMQADLSYSSMGFKESYFVTPTTIRFDYLALPLQFRYQPLTHFYLTAGPQVNLLLGARNIDESSSYAVTNQYKKIDFGGTVGLGYEKNRWGFLARYYYGLSNINAMSGFAPGSHNLRNTSVQIVFTYTVWRKNE